MQLDDDYISEACFYLMELGIAVEEIGKQLNLTADQVSEAVASFKSMIVSGKVSYDEDAKSFWAKNLRENTGDEKITLVDEKGRYYHGWKSEIEKMSTEQLVQLLVVNKQYSDRHPLSEFSKTQPVVGYDPLIPLRNIRQTVSMIDKILEEREKTEQG